MRGLERATTRLPLAGEIHTPAAKEAAAQVARFFAAKHEINVPQCFDGRFTLLNRTHDFGGADQIDWRVDMDDGSYPLWRANLAFMGWLCTAFDHDPERALGFAETVIGSFRDQARFQQSSDFMDVWNSYPVAHRVHSLAAILIRLPESLANRPERATLDAFLRFNTAYLLGNLETELGYNHLERNLSALALYAMATNTMPARVASALKRHFPHIIGETFTSDGLQVERSAMYQALSLQSLSVLRALTLWTPEEAALLASRQSAAEDALAALTLGDDQPIMMNDAWMGETPTTSILLDRRPPPGFVALPEAGYVRLAADDAVVVFDAGPIGPDANPGHGHADFLSIEMSLGADRLVVDPGTTNYKPGPQRNLERSWHAHNGPAVAGAHPVKYLGSFKVGSRVAARLGDWGTESGRQWTEGSLTFGSIDVRRRVTMGPKAVLTIEDFWYGGDGARASRFLVPDQWEIISAEAEEIRLQRNGRNVTMTCDRGAFTVEPSHWTCKYNHTFDAHAITMRPNSDAATIQISWSGGTATQD